MLLLTLSVCDNPLEIIHPYRFNLSSGRLELYFMNKHISKLLKVWIKQCDFVLLKYFFSLGRTIKTENRALSTIYHYSIVLKYTILKWFIQGCSPMNVQNGCNDPEKYPRSWLSYNILRLATVGENQFWMQLP